MLLQVALFHYFLWLGSIPLWDFSGGSAVKKNLPAMQEMWVRSLSQKDPLEEGMATHSSVLAWRIPGQRSLAGCSPWGHKDLDTAKVTEHTLKSIPLCVCTHTMKYHT